MMIDEEILKFLKEGEVRRAIEMMEIKVLHGHGWIPSLIITPILHFHNFTCRKELKPNLFS
jgi:hypothetical protein